MNFAIDSLTNLKTYLGNDFVQGFYGANKMPVPQTTTTRRAMQGTLTPTTFYWALFHDETIDFQETPVSDITFTDTVTAI